LSPASHSRGLLPVLEWQLRNADNELLGFTAVDVGSAFKVTFTQSDTYSVIITASEKIFDRKEVTRNGNTLKTDIQPGTTFTGISNLAAQITMPELDNVVLSGATHGTAAGFRSTGPFVANESGASSLEMTNFESMASPDA